MKNKNDHHGFTLIELLISVAIAVVLIAAMDGIIDHVLKVNAFSRIKNNNIQNTHFAMQRMVEVVSKSPRLLLPMSDNSSTSFRENVREQTVPASPPETGSILATAVLAVTLPLEFDLDSDGFPDADNDKDGLVDEDLPADIHNDGKAGIRDFDDDGNGTKDFFLSPAGDDDESNDLAQSEDPVDLFDDDGDGNIDEDPPADNNGDGAAGIIGIDDDNDGSIDEGSANDDDEDGISDEDWLDPIVYYLNNGALIERIAVPWDENSSGGIDGQDFIESTLAENVTLLRFERVAVSVLNRAQIIDITLELTPPDGEAYRLHTKVRVSGNL